MDYCSELTNFHIQSNREYGEMLLERMEHEADFMLSCLENYQVIVTEAADVEKNTKSFWEKIKEFFARIFSVFSKKAKMLVERDSEWLDKNYNKFEKINYDNLSIKMVPFWLNPFSKVKTEATKFNNLFNSILSNTKLLEKYKDIKVLKEEFLKNYLDSSGELTNGLKKFYMVGDSNGKLELTELQGNSLKEKVLEFRDYCNKYYRDVEPYVKKLMNDTEKQMQRIERAISTKPVTDSFCLLEDNYYKNTELATCEGFNEAFDIVSEGFFKKSNKEQSGISKFIEDYKTNYRHIRQLQTENKYLALRPKLMGMVEQAVYIRELEFLKKDKEIGKNQLQNRAKHSNEVMAKAINAHILWLDTVYTKAIDRKINQLKAKGVTEATESTDINKDVSPTEVSVIDKNDDKVNKDEAEKTEQKKYDSMSGSQLSFLKNANQILQLNVTAVMSVEEQRYNAYMKVLRNIITARGNDTDNVKKESDDINTETKSKKI